MARTPIENIVLFLRQACRKTSCSECPYAYSEKEGGEKYLCRLSIPGAGCPSGWDPNAPDLRWR